MIDDDDYTEVDDLPPMPRQDIPAADRELLELAARALGAVRAEEVEGEGHVNLYFTDGSIVYAWNPLRFSGDAFDVAAHLRMQTTQYEHEVCVAQSSMAPLCEAVAEDRSAATRLAIVRVAAEIGKNV